MTFKFLIKATGVACLLAAFLPTGRANVTGYTNQSDFNTAVSSGFNPLSVTNFDSLTTGTIIPSGGSVNGITFNYSIGGGAYQLQVGSTFDTTSSPNYLGTTGDDAFLSGDQFTLNFASPVQAVGLFVISGGNDLAGDYTLSVSGGSVPSSGSTDSTYGTLGDGGNVYFLGLVDSTQTFTSATFSSLGGLGIPFNIDDISTTTAAAQQGGGGTVPEDPSTFGLLTGALAGLLALRRRRS
jgi:hypothetical protein